MMHNLFLVTDSFHGDSNRDNESQAVNGATGGEVTVEGDGESSDSGPSMTCKVRIQSLSNTEVKKKKKACPFRLLTKPISYHLRRNNLNGEDGRCFYGLTILKHMPPTSVLTVDTYPNPL